MLEGCYGILASPWRVGIGTVGLGGVLVILFKNHSESENTLVWKIYSRGKNYALYHVLLWMVNEQIQTREALYFSSKSVFFWIPLVKLKCFFYIFTLDLSSETLSNKISITNKNYTVYDNCRTSCMLIG